MRHRASNINYGRSMFAACSGVSMMPPPAGAAALSGRRIGNARRTVFDRERSSTSPPWPPIARRPERTACFAFCSGRHFHFSGSACHGRQGRKTGGGTHESASGNAQRPWGFTTWRLLHGTVRSDERRQFPALLLLLVGLTNLGQVSIILDIRTVLQRATFAERRHASDSATVPVRRG